jgi:hypothetical protein
VSQQDVTARKTKPSLALTTRVGDFWKELLGCVCEMAVDKCTFDFNPKSIVKLAQGHLNLTLNEGRKLFEHVRQAFSVTRYSARQDF